MLWHRTSPSSLLTASCSFACLCPPCYLHADAHAWPSRLQRCFRSARLPQHASFANIHLIFFAIYHLIFFCPLKQTANANPAVRIVENNKKILKKEKSEGKHKTERQLNISQTEREKVKLQQWVAKAKSIELNNPSNTSLCL